MGIKSMAYVMLGGTALAAVIILLRPVVAEGIEADFSKSNYRDLDLARAVPQAWERVCIFGPYTDRARTNAVLGFDWDSTANSAIARDDTITLLVFVSARDKVVDFADYPREEADFSNLSGKCFTRQQAHFRQVDHPTAGVAGLFPMDPVPAAQSSAQP